MKYSELQNNINNGMSIKLCDIKIVKYLPIMEKMAMIEGFKNESIDSQGIIECCLENKNDFIKINHFYKEIALVISVIKWYTDIEFDVDEQDWKIYDYLIKNDIWDHIKSQIPEKEYTSIINYLDKALEQELMINNSVPGVLSKALYKLISKAPTVEEMKKIGKSLIKDINKLNWNNIPTIKKLYDFVNSENKAISENK